MDLQNVSRACSSPSVEFCELRGKLDRFLEEETRISARFPFRERLTLKLDSGRSKRENKQRKQLRDVVHLTAPAEISSAKWLHGGSHLVTADVLAPASVDWTWEVPDIGLLCAFPRHNLGIM